MLPPRDQKRCIFALLNTIAFALSTLPPVAIHSTVTSRELNSNEILKGNFKLHDLMSHKAQIFNGTPSFISSDRVCNNFLLFFEE